MMGAEIVMHAKISFTTYHLKLIAFFLMVIDHIGAFVQDTPIWFRYLGRISAPLFIFCMVWGMDYTRNRTRYLLRLYIASICMELFWIIIDTFHMNPESHHNNIFATLFVIGTSIMILERKNEKNSRYFNVILILVWQVLCVGIYLFWIYNLSDTWGNLVMVATGNLFLCEGGFRIFVLGMILYYTKHSKKKLALGYTAYVLICAAIFATSIVARLMYFVEYHRILGEGFEVLVFIQTLFSQRMYIEIPLVPHGLYFGDYQWMMIGALPFMLRYNNKLGKSHKWFFYVAYPVHIAILLCVGQVVL